VLNMFRGIRDISSSTPAISSSQYSAAATSFDTATHACGSAYENKAAASVTAIRINGVTDVVESYCAADMAA
jgi:hypothetical protein